MNATPQPNNYPKLHNAMWPGLVGKEAGTDHPPIGLDRMLELTVNAEVNDPRRPTPPADIPLSRPLDLRAEAAEPSVRERTTAPPDKRGFNPANIACRMDVTPGRTCTFSTVKPGATLTEA